MNRPIFCDICDELIDPESDYHCGPIDEFYHADCCPDCQAEEQPSSVALFNAVTSKTPTPTTRLLYVDLTDPDCFKKFDERTAILQPAVQCQVEADGDCVWA